MRQRPWVALLAVLPLVVSCAASSPYMRAASAHPVTAAPQGATVVFLRPSGWAANMLATILDGSGRFLGDSLAESYFAVMVPPGEHIFVGWSENTAAMRATLAAGKVYYVEVSPRMGFASARVQLLAITRRSDGWRNLQRWLAGSKQLEPDEAAGQAYLRSCQRDVEGRLRRAREILTEYNQEEMEARTLRPEDGQ